MFFFENESVKENFMRKVLPKELTSYDLLKALAIILMITDHVGHHFYPDEMWFRILGRLCVPIWFFLVGYAKTTELPKRLWIGGLIVAVSGIVAGQYLMPLNILFTIIVLRYLRGGLVRNGLHSPDALRGIFLVILFMGLPTAILFEYGTMSMLFVLFGYIVRHKEEVYEKIEPQYVKIFVAISFFSFFLIEGLGLPAVSASQAMAMFFGFVGVGWTLWNFRGAVYVDASHHMAPSIIKVIQFMGRRTLEIYVVHIVIFRAVAMILYPDRYKFLDWHYVPSSLIQMFT
ncbi:MAG: hypothetical protein COA45_01485 [Zetaproteobacteria bacterium]|nr:MAG: hypothetical protein COA45_01485 [Zetaproteobacteria bacterium]